MLLEGRFIFLKKIDPCGCDFRHIELLLERADNPAAVKMQRCR